MELNQKENRKITRIITDSVIPNTILRLVLVYERCKREGEVSLYFQEINFRKKKDFDIVISGHFFYCHFYIIKVLFSLQIAIWVQ